MSFHVPRTYLCTSVFLFYNTTYSSILNIYVAGSFGSLVRIYHAPRRYIFRMVITAIKNQLSCDSLGRNGVPFCETWRVACVTRPRGSCTSYITSVLVQETKGMAAIGRGLFNLLCQGWLHKRAVWPALHEALRQEPCMNKIKHLFLIWWLRVSVHSSTVV
jgi:hypothetical protein